MVPLLRSLLFLFLVSMLWVAVPLFANEPLRAPQPLVRAGAEPLSPPSLPRPKADNSQLDGLRASFSNPKGGSQENSFASAPMSGGVSHASFIEQPTATQSLAFEEEFDEEDFDEFFEEEEEFNATLDKELFSKRLAKATGEDDEEESKGGWTNKLVKPEFTPMLSVGGSLLIVIAAFFLLAALFRKVAPQGNRPLPKEAFECLGRHFISQKHQLQVLRLGNRIVLVSVMPEGVTSLAEITDPDEVVAFLGHFRRLDSNSATEIFRKTVASISDEELNRMHQRPVVTSRRREPASTLDLYSEPDESLASILARGRNYGR